MLIVRHHHFNRIKLGGVAILLSLGFAGGCNDPYSRNRIARREAHIKQFADDVGASEARRAERLREAGETAKRWWVRDSERFERRWPTIPDYIW